MAKKLPIKPSDELSEFLLYTAPDGAVKVEIYFQNETVWLTQDKIALLFGVQRPAISKHLKNIFGSRELDEKVVSSILEHTSQIELSKLRFISKTKRYGLRNKRFLIYLL